MGKLLVYESAAAARRSPAVRQEHQPETRQPSHRCRCKADIHGVEADAVGEKGAICGIGRLHRSRRRKAYRRW